MARRRTLCTALATTAFFAGCGSDDPVLVEGGTLDLRLAEYRITPQEVRVKAGRLTIVAINDGVLTHNAKVEPERDPDADATPSPIGGTDTAQPGQTVRGEIDLEPGTYRMVCTIGNHEDLGQYGTLTVG